MPPYQGNVEELTHRLRLIDFFTYYDEDSHQCAAIQRLEDAINKADPSILESTAEWYKDWTYCVGGKRNSEVRRRVFYDDVEDLRLQAELIGLE